MTAYISVLKFLQVSVKSIAHFKIVIALYMPVLFLSTAIQLKVPIQSADTQIQLIQYDQFNPGKYRLLYLKGHFLPKQRDVAIIDSFIKQLLQLVNGLNIINYTYVIL